MLTRNDIRVGQTLQLNHGKVGSLTVKVIKVNPKNIKVTTEDGQIWNAHPSFLSLTTDTFRDPAAAKYQPGTVVHTTEIASLASQPLVVIEYKAGGYNLAPLGGGTVRKGFAEDCLEVVDFTVA